MRECVSVCVCVCVCVSVCVHACIGYECSRVKGAHSGISTTSSAFKVLIQSSFTSVAIYLCV